MVWSRTGAGRPRRPHPLRLDGRARLARDLRQRRLEVTTAEVIRPEIFLEQLELILNGAAFIIQICTE